MDLNQDRARRRISQFALYLRTGRRGNDAPIEFKFNPYHDPSNGQFTFGPGGMGGGNAANRERRGAQRSFGQMATKPNDLDPKNPRNYTVHVVKRGETLAKIAALRHGVTSADLAWLNDVPIGGRLYVGQQIKLPTQASRDAAREAKNTFLALDYYMQTHGGRLPPNVAHPPSLQTQVADQSSWRDIQANGYHFSLDPENRTRRANGEIPTDRAGTRSRRNQARAGGGDRLPSDDGGHYIAVRFNGPRERFNHFAQDANFNRGEYRVLEDRLARAKRQGHSVYIDIVPHYISSSQRPDTLAVTWFIDGKRFFRNFLNKKKVY